MGFPDSSCNYLRIRTPVVVLLLLLLGVTLSAFLGFPILQTFLLFTSTAAAFILSTLLFTFKSTAAASNHQKPCHQSPESPELVLQDHPEEAHHNQVPQENITQQQDRGDRTRLITIGHELNLVANGPSPAAFQSSNDESQQVGRSSSSTEDSEVMEWMLQDQVLGSPDWSDDESISDHHDDEESLFEIALGLPVEPSCRFNKQALLVRKKSPDLLLKHQYGPMELYLAELNHEEDNFIEIDIFMGSIKCPTSFQIQA